MNERERAIIEAIIDKSDKRRHDKALTLLLYGEERGDGFVKNEYVRCLENLVRKKFDKSVPFADTYSIFATEFWMHLDKMTPERLYGIIDLNAWLFEVARNYIETIRNKIEEFQLNKGSLNEDVLTVETDDNNEVDTDELDNDMDNNSEEDEENDCAKQSRELSVLIPFDETEQDKLKRLNFAKWRFRHYLNQMANETYKDLLTAVYIEGIDRETIAEEYGWTMANFNLVLDHARNAFIAVALDDIRRCEPDLFRKYEYHEDMDDETANLLREFFICKFDVQQLALLHHMNNYAMKMALAKAYKKLLKIHKNETEVIEKEIHKEEKRQKRMKRLYEMYKSTLMKEYPEAFWQLTRYFKDFDGEISVMTEWALNNNTSVDELERQLEASFDLLNAIDKERSSKKNNSNEKESNN